MSDIERQLDRAYNVAVLLFSVLGTCGFLGIIGCLIFAPVWIPCGIALSSASFGFLGIFVWMKKANTASE